MSKSFEAVQRWFNPEIGMGGFARNDHRVVFFTRVNALLEPDWTVVDVGAGRGKWAAIEKGYKGKLTSLRGKCREFIGADVDPAVMENPMVDRAIVIGPDGRIPLPDGSVDMVVSWATFEHVGDPAMLSAELTRILKPGGYICASTPNRWSYFAIGAQLTPFALHRRVLRVIGPGLRKDVDVFPTVYRVNSLGAVRKWFPAAQYENYSYICNGPPSYHGGFLPLAMLWATWQWLLPTFFGQTMHIFLRRRGYNSSGGTLSQSQNPQTPR